MVEFATHVTESADSVSVGEFAKILKKENIPIGRNRLFTWLRDNHYLMENNVPYQTYIERGYFDVVEVVKTTSYGDMMFPTTMIKGKGQVALLEKIKEELEGN